MSDTHENEPVESTLQEDLAKALQEAEESEDVSQAVEEPEEEVEEEPPEEEEDASDEPSHDEENDDEPDEESESDEAESEEETEDSLEAPEHWPARDKEIFSEAPKEIQEWALRRDKEREADYTRKTQEIASIRKRGEALEEVIAPYRQEFQLSGMDDVSAIRQLFAVHDSLKNDPSGTIQWLAQTYGADLTQTQEEVDPTVAALQRQIQQLHQEQQRSQSAQQEQQQQALVKQIEAFENEKGEDGKLKHPHFQDVHDDMTRLFQSGMATTLEDAYEKAVNLRPDLRQVIQKQTQEQTRQKQKAEKAKQAKRAKKAASGVKSSGASVKQDKPKTLRDELSALIDQQS